MPVSKLPWGLCVVVLGLGVAQAAEQTEDAVADEPEGRYTTREERREAGRRYALSEWLLLSGLLEFEYQDESFEPREGGPAPHHNGSERAAEAVLEIEGSDWAYGEFVWEFDDEIDAVRLDEGLWVFEFGALEVEFGKLYVPFGEYFSHFVTGPLIEFGETRGQAVVLGWSPADDLEFSLYAYRGRARPQGRRGRDTNWGLSLEAPMGALGTLGLAYLADLADSDERLLEEAGDRYARRVGAFNAWLVGGGGAFEYSLEWLTALRPFAELEPESDRPQAWNLELAFYPVDVLGLSLRLEGSRELEDEPRRQWGVSAAWQFASNGFLTLEGLRGDFRAGFVEDDQERELDGVERFAAQLSFGL